MSPDWEFLQFLNDKSIATMKKRHNVALSTLLIIGIITLCARDQELPLKVPRSKKASAKTEKTKADSTGMPFVHDSHAQGERGDGVTLALLPPVVEPSVQPFTESGVSDAGHGLPLVSDEGEQPLSLILPTPSEPEAYATFMGTRNPSIHDPYFLALLSLIHRVLWSPRSRTSKYPFVVFVSDYVTTEQRSLLSGAGPIVRELAPLVWMPNVPGVEKRWKDLFAKLNMWKETEFERILFLDADAFPLVNIDGMFDAAPVQQCVEEKVQLDDYLADGTSVCEPFVFAGVAQDPWSGTSTDVNAGSMVFTPSLRMHERLLQNYFKTDKYNCLMAEQAFLNWQFSKDGAFPASTLERKWGGVFPTGEEEGSLNVVHEKIWFEKDGWLKMEWEKMWVEMVKYYESEEFRTMRGCDGLAPSHLHPA